MFNLSKFLRSKKNEKPVDDNKQRCYLCQRELSAENRSSEHIFPEAIGGYLESSDLLCQSCNSETGNTIDASLCNMLNVWTLYHPVKRKKPAPTSMVTLLDDPNTEIVVSQKWNTWLLHPKFEMKDGILHIEGGSKERVIAEFEKIRKHGLNGEFVIDPNYNYTFVKNEIPLKQKVTYTVGEFNGHSVIRSIAKICTNYYLFKTKKCNNVIKISEYVSAGSEQIPGWLTDPSIGKDMFPNKPYHLLYIRGDKKKRYLIAYIEFYCSVGAVVILNGQYNDESIQLCYAFDPTTHEEIPFNYSAEFSFEQVSRYIASKPMKFGFETIEPK